MHILEKDIQFIKNKWLPWTGLRAVYISWSNSAKKYPDIWVDMYKGIPRITITREWAGHDKHLRRSQLVHEGLHVLGMKHDESIGYSTIPSRDSYSKKVYRRLI